MCKDEILRYIVCCVNYRHTNDLSIQITKSACEHEDVLYKCAIDFLRQLDKDNKVFVKENR